jgi:hypothetical protein
MILLIQFYKGNIQTDIIQITGLRDGQTHLNLLGFLLNIHYSIPHPTFSL